MPSMFLTLCVTLTWDAEGDYKKIDKVLEKFEEQRQPRKNSNYKRYKFFSRAQESDEIIDQYVTVLRKISETCEFVTLKNSLIKDRIVLGINDATDKREIVRDFRPRPGKGYRRSSICGGNRKIIKGHDKVDKPLICTWNMMELEWRRKTNTLHSKEYPRPMKIDPLQAR